MTTTTDKPDDDPRIYFFGCWRVPGHYLHRPGGTKDWGLASNPWGTDIDGKIQPEQELPCTGAGLPAVLISYRDGWTAYAFWDRTVDRRPNSCGAFLVDKVVTGPQVVELAQKHFPQIWKRLHRQAEAGDG